MDIIIVEFVLVAFKIIILLTGQGDGEMERVREADLGGEMQVGVVRN